jgi:hypothetical protein
MQDTRTTISMLAVMFRKSLSLRTRARLGGPEVKIQSLHFKGLFTCGYADV